MDDIFDLTASEERSELEVASRDWQGRMQEVSLSALRDGLHDGRESTLQAHFDSGVRDGFAVVGKLAFMKGRLLGRMALDSKYRKEYEELKNAVEVKEQQLLTTLLQVVDELPQSHVSSREADELISVIRTSLQVDQKCLS